MQKFKTVTEYLESLGQDKQEQVSRLRDLILEAAPELEEHIKWNAISYRLGDIDCLTFNTMNKDNSVKLVLHMGTSRKEDKTLSPIVTGLSMVEWASNIRGYITFDSLDDVSNNSAKIQRTISDWVQCVMEAEKLYE